ncbi:helix-turn-helix domain-containing protein [Solitalea sp. MAHUQ-68]|uniref:Helix-turn-helix domain-containing protein n=1 Tax=Solitalea agri TaxID=2953739 RepID=A0A9X2F2T6_9SPHI|nr:helix-turn-helix transcriptional regulator [Solitalea agri]MCO4293181.1 helix-turn-helix domain-containing protein [Solitalea agri]
MHAPTRYYTISPPVELTNYVRFFWVFEMDLPPQQEYVYRSLADSCAEMVFHYKGLFTSADDLTDRTKVYSMIHAQTNNYRRFVTQGSFGIFGVYLFPFSIPRLLSIASNELTNQIPDLKSLLGQSGVDLEEKMMLALDNTARVKIVSEFLINRLQQQRKAPAIIQQAIVEAIRKEGKINIGEFPDQFFLSTRQFERQFKENAGFSLKTYSRILRFHSALKEFGDKQISLTELALNCGYYDQSHFVNDFKSFSGYTPGQYFKGFAEGTEYRQAD